MLQAQQDLVVQMVQLIHHQKTFVAFRQISVQGSRKGSARASEGRLGGSAVQRKPAYARRRVITADSIVMRYFTSVPTCCTP